MWLKVRQILAVSAQWSGKGVSFLTLAMVLLMFINTLLSELFSISFIAVQEAVTWIHAAVFMLGAAYTLQQNEHVRVDIFYQKFQPKTQAVIDIVGTLLFLFPLCAFIIYSSWDFVSFSWKLGESSQESGGLPALYLLKSLIIVMPVLLVIEGLHQIACRLEQITSKTEGAAQ